MCKKRIKWNELGIIVLRYLSYSSFGRVSSDSTNLILFFQVSFLRALKTGIPEDKSINSYKFEFWVYQEMGTRHSDKFIINEYKSDLFPPVSVNCTNTSCIDPNCYTTKTHCQWLCKPQHRTLLRQRYETNTVTYSRQIDWQAAVTSINILKNYWICIY
jgi:hypothetical protein